jgi:hypothetical protein
MKRKSRRHIAPQHEFGFSVETFNLFAETAIDGERIAREKGDADRARIQAEAGQAALFPSTPKMP